MEEEQERICPICGRKYEEPPALSRRDNQTNICPSCGMREAMEDFFGSRKVKP